MTILLRSTKRCRDYTEPQRIDWQLEFQEAEARAERLAGNIRRAKRYLKVQQKPRGEKWTKAEVSRILRSLELARKELER